MASTELHSPLLPFARPLSHTDFDNARFAAYHMSRKLRRRLPIEDADSIAREYGVDETHRIAIASYLFDYIHENGLPPANKDPAQSNAAVKHAALIRDVCRKGRRKTPTMRQLAERHGVHEKSIPRFMRIAGYRKLNGRWVPMDADRHLKAFKGKVRAHKQWLELHRARCAWVALPEGPIDLGAICSLKTGIVCKHGRIMESYLLRGNGELGGDGSFCPVARGNYLMQKPSALEYLLSQEVTLGIPSGSDYPAIIFPNGQLVFLHIRNYLISHRRIALPPGVELHHIDDNPWNASAVNNVAVLRPEHNAWHTRKRSKG